ncbi:MAG: PDR/VanB family oxidoreductase [Gordonia sp. (in: high G+C Gram-positive bacteria)]
MSSDRTTFGSLTVNHGGAAVAASFIDVVVTARRALTGRVEEFTLAAVDGSALPPWSPGSHIDLVLRTGLVRQYSLCSNPSDLSRYMVAIDRRDDGRGGSAYAHESLTVGTVISISFPRNHFALTRANEYVFVAGGIGITPMLSLIAQATSSGRAWRMIYLARSRADMPYLSDLRGRYGDRVRIHESSLDGRIDLSAELAGLSRGTAVYACGPATMLVDVADACDTQPAVDSFTERFTMRDIGDRVNTVFEVALAYSGETFSVPPDKSILDILDEKGVLAPSSCREGMCGTCEVGVVSGEIDHRDSVLTPEEQSENESMMVCVSRCTSGRLVLEL